MNKCIAPVEKFHEYIFRPGATHGKDHILGSLGYGSKMMLENYSRVRLQTDKYQSEGAYRFDVGYIIEVYSDNKYEVEFSDLNGMMTAQIVASEKELELAPPTFDAPKREMSAEPIQEQQK